MKKIFIFLLAIVFLFSGIFVQAVTQEGYHETGDIQIEDEVVNWQSNDEMDQLLGTAGTSIKDINEKRETMNDDEFQSFLEDVGDALGDDYEITFNQDGKSMTSTEATTTDQNAFGEVVKEGSVTQTGVEGATQKDVTQVDAEEGTYIGIHHMNNSDSGSCTDTWKDRSCKKDSTTGTKATTENIPFLASIDPTSENTKTNPFQKGSTFKILGDRHIIREGTNPNKTETTKTCGKRDKIVCSKDISSHEKKSGKCTSTWKEIDYGTPTYQDHYKGVEVDFIGFKVRVGENDVTSDIISTSSSTEAQESTRPELTNDKYTKGYVITEILKDKLEQDSDTGLLKGKIEVTCLCEDAESETFDVYFNITTPTINEEIYSLKVEVDGLGIATIGDKEDTTAYGVVNTPFNIKAKADEGYIFDAWYEPNNAYYRGESDWYETARKYNDNKNCTVDMPGYNYVLIARFIPKTPNTYKVEIYTDGNGTINVDGVEGNRLYLEVPEGEILNIDAIPYKDNEHEYEFSEWTEIVDGKVRTYDDNDPLILEVNRDYILIANFNGVRGNFHTLTIDINDKNNGFVIPYGDIDAITGRNYDIYAFPHDGFYFRYWRDDNNDITAYGQFDEIEMPDDDYELIAHIFNIGNSQLILESAGGGTVAIDDDSFSLKDSLTVRELNEVHYLKAKPNKDFKFAYFEDKYGRRIYAEECEKENGIYKASVTGDKKDILYIAYFEYVGDRETYELKVECTEGGDAWRTIPRAVPGEWYRISAKADEGYIFRRWIDDEGKRISGYERTWVKMKERAYVVTACFDKEPTPEPMYELTIKTDGEGRVTGSGEYPKGKRVEITATPDRGYKFVGWYEDNGLISTEQNDSIYMYRDRNLIAKFIKDDEVYNSSFKVISIRDLRWQNYFVSGGKLLNNYLTIPKNATKNTVLVNSASLVNSSYNNQDRKVVYGYAVECELTTTDIECNVEDLDSRDNPSLIIKAKVSGNKSGKITIPDKYINISSGESADIDSFMISATKTYKEITVDGITMTTPVVTWRWVYYLPLDLEWIIDNQNSKNKEELTIQFEEIKVKVADNKYYDYIKAIETVDGNKWEGKVFTYRTDRTVLDDIYDNAQN